MNEEPKAERLKQLEAVSASIDASLAQIVTAMDALGISKDLLKQMAPPEFWDQLEQYRK